MKCLNGKKSLFEFLYILVHFSDTKQVISLNNHTISIKNENEIEKNENHNIIKCKMSCLNYVNIFLFR